MPAPITNTLTIPPDRRRPPFTDGAYLSGTTWDDPSFEEVVMAEPDSKRVPAIFAQLSEI